MIYPKIELFELGPRNLIAPSTKLKVTYLLQSTSQFHFEIQCNYARVPATALTTFCVCRHCRSNVNRRNGRKIKSQLSAAGFPPETLRVPSVKTTNLCKSTYRHGPDRSSIINTHGEFRLVPVPSRACYSYTSPT